MLRDNWAGLIDPMRAARELNPLALFPEQEKSSVDRPQDALKIPAPKGRNLTLTENAASPFHAEPRHVNLERPAYVQQIIFARLRSWLALSSSRDSVSVSTICATHWRPSLINKENDTKTVQGLLRHANVSTTLGLYAQSVNSSMVEAQESMLKAILRNGSNAVN